jgi:hypothetical protein
MQVLAETLRVRVVVWPVELLNLTLGVQPAFRQEHGPLNSRQVLELVHWTRDSHGLHFDVLSRHNDSQVDLTEDAEQVWRATTIPGDSQVEFPPLSASSATLSEERRPQSSLRRLRRSVGHGIGAAPCLRALPDAQAHLASTFDPDLRLAGGRQPDVRQDVGRPDIGEVEMKEGLEEAGKHPQGRVSPSSLPRGAPPSRPTIPAVAPVPPPQHWSDTRSSPVVPAAPGHLDGPATDFADASPYNPWSAEAFDTAVGHLFHLWEKGEDCLEWLKQLPSIDPGVSAKSMEELASDFYTGAQSWIATGLTAESATFLRVPYWRTTSYPVAVVCEALGRCTGTPPILILDSFVALLTSIQHKDVTVENPPWITSARYWVAASAAAGCGRGRGGSQTNRVPGCKAL